MRRYTFTGDKALFVTGYGARIEIRKHTLLVTSGRCEEKPVVQQYKINPDSKPKTIINFSNDGFISFSALERLMNYGICYIQIGFQANPVAVTSAEKMRNVAGRRMQYCMDGATRLSMSKLLIKHKTQSQLETLQALGLKNAYQSINDHMIEGTKTFDQLRGLEGHLHKQYFGILRQLGKLPWHSDTRNLPDHWLAITDRESGIGYGHSAINPYHAFLNYGYGILAAQMKMNILATGLDEFCGLLHADKPNRESLVYDLIEPYRAVIDRQTWEYLQKYPLNTKTISADRTGRIIIIGEKLKEFASHLNLTECYHTVDWYYDSIMYKSATQAV